MERPALTDVSHPCCVYSQLRLNSFLFVCLLSMQTELNLRMYCVLDPVYLDYTTLCGDSV